MSEKRFSLLDETIFDNEKQAEDGGRVTYWVVEYGQRQRLVDLLNELGHVRQDGYDFRAPYQKYIEERVEWMKKYEDKRRIKTRRLI